MSGSLSPRQMRWRICRSRAVIMLEIALGREGAERDF
jgi:hypothetical protein